MHESGERAKDGVVSVVMPTYNRAHYMPTAINSLIEQTYPHWELVIVDDCSTDSTFEVATEYAESDSRIRVIRHEVNRKLPGALNTGFDNACGEYFTWLSDDDLFRPNALEAMVRFLEEHPQIDMVYTDYTEIDQDGQPIRQIVVGPPEELGLQNPIGVCHLSRRHVHETINGYDENFFLVEDLDFCIRAFINFPMLPYHKDLFLYRQHQGSLTSTSKHVYRLHGEVFKKHLPQMHWMTPDRTAHAYIRQGKRAFQHRDFIPGLDNFRRAFAASSTFCMKFLSTKIREHLLGRTMTSSLGSDAHN